MPAIPQIKEENNQTTYCPGTQVKLMVDNFSTDYEYQWQRSGVNIPGADNWYFSGYLQAGDYMVKVTSGTCQTESGILTMTTKDAPAKPDIFVVGNKIWTVGCSNDTAKAYRWYWNGKPIPNANKHLYLAGNTEGEYYVEINDGSDCWTMSDIIILPGGDIISDIPILEAEMVTVYPNPSDGLFQVYLGGKLTGEINAEIFDALGNRVQTLTIKNTDAFKVNLAQMKPGVYYCKMLFKGVIVTKKMVKE
jgi:hypothetical protein